MEVVCVSTSDSRAYYSIMTRLRNTNLKSASVTPGEAARKECSLIITTNAELGLFKGQAIAIEELDDNSLIMEGQILSRMHDRRNRTILIGIDPGSRIGLAVYYGDDQLAGLTFNSLDNLRGFIVKMVKVIPNSGAVIKIGDGSPELCKLIADMMINTVPPVRIEIVDEKGTSLGKPGSGGLTRDQSAAARIALRRGVEYRIH